MGMLRNRTNRAARIACLALVVVAIALAGCRRRRPPELPSAPPKPPAPTAVETGISDVATGGDWESGGRSGTYRVVVRGGGRRALRSDVLLQWLAWDARSEQPIEVSSVRVTELSRG